MISLKRNQRGFTIVELLIVIVIIAILATLVFVTFSNTQKKARDTDRRNDINGMYQLLETYFAEQSEYPTLANLNSDTWRDANLRDMKADLITAPNGGAALVATGGAINNYVYDVGPDGCDNTDGNECTEYQLTATLETGGTFSKSGSNN